MFARWRARADDPGFAFLCLANLQSGVGGDAESGAVACDLDRLGASSYGGRGAFPAGPGHVTCRPSVLPLVRCRRALDRFCRKCGRVRVSSVSCLVGLSFVHVLLLFQASGFRFRLFTGVVESLSTVAVFDNVLLDHT